MENPVAAIYDNSRPTFTYTIPKGDAQQEVEGLGSIKSVTLVQLTAGDEMLATARARGDVMRLAYEMARQGVHAVNGTRLNTGDGILDVFWEKAHPKLRTMIITAYSKINQPAQDELNAFLGSCEIKA